MFCDLRIVIWGLGTNGKNLIDLFGAEKVIAVIDSNPDKRAMKFYQDIPIIDFDTYLREYRDIIVIISSMRYDGIEKKLRDNQIKHYLILNENKVSLLAFDLLKSDQFIEKYSLEKNRTYYITGVNLFSICLYRYLLERGMTAYLLACNQRQIEQLEVFEKQNIIKGFLSETEYVDNAFILKMDDMVPERSESLGVVDYENINGEIYQAWKKDLQTFKDCHYGERMFVVATGPSIRIEDLEKLEELHELTISMNGIIYILEKTTWRPNYYVASDGEMIRIYEAETDKEQYLKKTQKFFSDNYLRYWETKRDGTYHCFHQMQSPYDIGFSTDCSEKVYAGFTVVYACIQLAVYMGIKEIYLLGCDFSFSQDMKDSVNHCYDKSSQFYTFDFEGVSRGYECAKKYAEEHGIKIFNATRGGKLEIFERVDLDSII